MNIYKKRFDELSPLELYNILKLRAEVFALEQEILYLDQDKIDFDCTHYFIQDDTGVYAYMRIIDKGVKYKNDYSFGRFCVRKDRRGKGLGRILMMEAINDFERTHIRISGQAYLKDFYITLGFRQTSEPYMEEGITHIEFYYGK